jgi:hypothetical protein
MLKYSKLLSRLFKRPVIVIEPLEPFDVKEVSQEPVIVDCLDAVDEGDISEPFDS